MAPPRAPCGLLAALAVAVGAAVAASPRLCPAGGGDAAGPNARPCPPAAGAAPPAAGSAAAAAAAAAEPAALVQTRRQRQGRRQGQRGKAAEVACPPGDAVSNRIIDSDIIVTSGVCRVHNFTTTGSFLVSANGSLVIDGNATVRGGVEVTSAQPGHVRLLGAQVKYVSLFDSGNLDVGPGAELGSIQVESSGNVSVAGASASKVSLMSSGALDVGAGAALGALELERSGRVAIAGDSQVMSVKSLMSGGLTLRSMRVIEAIEVQGSSGDFLLSDVVAGGPIDVLHSQGSLIELLNVTSPDTVTLENCPASDVQLSAVEVWSVSMLRVGEVALGGGSRMGQFEVEASGNVTIGEASTADVLVTQCGDLTVTGGGADGTGADLGAIWAERSGRLTVAAATPAAAANSSSGFAPAAAANSSGGGGGGGEIRLAALHAEKLSGGLALGGGGGGGGVRVAGGVEVTDLTGDLLLDSVALGGPVDVSKSPDSPVRLAGVEASGVYLSDGGNLTVMRNSSLGTVVMEKSGHAAIDGVTADVLLVSSGDLTVSAGSRVRNVHLVGSGRANFGMGAEATRLSCISSGGLLLEEGCAVAEGIEVSSGHGNITLNHASVGGPLTLVGNRGSVAIAGANLSAGGLAAIDVVGSVSVEDSVLRGARIDKLEGSAALSHVEVHDVSFKVVHGNVDMFGVTSDGETTIMDLNGNVSVISCEFTGATTMNSHLTLSKVTGAVVELNTFHHGDVVAEEVGNLMVRGNRATSLAVKANSGLVTLRSNNFTDAHLSANHGGVVISDNAFDLLDCLANRIPPNVAANNVIGTASGQCSQ